MCANGSGDVKRSNLHVGILRRDRLQFTTSESIFHLNLLFHSGLKICIRIFSRKRIMTNWFGYDLSISEVYVLTISRIRNFIIEDHLQCESTGLGMD